jgi:peptide/nickel transport system substrate-binding protein
MNIRRMLALALTVGLVTLTGGVAASAATAKATHHSSSTSSVTISNEQGTTWACGFNPFNASVLSEGLVFGQTYEELVYVNSLKNGAATPWLASAYTWSNGNKTLTFTIRSGVKWSDGVPFTAKDVVFTFDLIRKYKALDLNADWSVLSSVALKGTNQVVFNFKTAAVPYFFYIADQTPIVPEHIWASIKNPVTYINSKPVGTGPYVMSKCTPANVTYTKNPLYWQKGFPKIDTVYYPSFTSNDPANEELANGTAQWGSQFIPSIQTYYLSKSKDYHIWFPPISNVSIFPNLTNSLLGQLAVRQAMAYAIDRQRVSKIGEYGYEPASNQTDVVTPTFKSWLDTSEAAQFNYTYNPKKALSILKSAGYKMSGGVMTKDGKSLSFTMINIGGYSDWVASALIIKQELAAVGIQVTAENLAATSYFAKLYTGDYQLAYGSETGGPTPYYELRQLLYSANSAPIGQNASTNWERFSNKQVDALINSYGATTSTAAQHQIVDELEEVMLRGVPVIPMTEEVDWYQYDTAKIGGWPTPSDPYAQPAAYAYPDMGVVLLHLYPKS